MASHSTLIGNCWITRRIYYENVIRCITFAKRTAYIDKLKIPTSWSTSLSVLFGIRCRLVTKYLDISAHRILEIFQRDIGINGR